MLKVGDVIAVYTRVPRGQALERRYAGRYWTNGDWVALLDDPRGLLRALPRCGRVNGRVRRAIQSVTGSGYMVVLRERVADMYFPDPPEVDPAFTIPLPVPTGPNRDEQVPALLNRRAFQARAQVPAAGNVWLAVSFDLPAATPTWPGLRIDFEDLVVGIASQSVAALAHSTCSDPCEQAWHVSQSLYALRCDIRGAEEIACLTLAADVGERCGARILEPFPFVIGSGATFEDAEQALRTRPLGRRP